MVSPALLFADTPVALVETAGGGGGVGVGLSSMPEKFVLKDSENVVPCEFKQCR